MGEVFNLKQLSDFVGTYKVTGSQYTVGRSADDVSLANERGVVMILALKGPTTTPDVTLTPSPTGLTVTLEPSPHDRARGVGGRGAMTALAERSPDVV